METSLTGKALNFGFNEYGFESRVSKMNCNYSVAHVVNMINIHSASKRLIFDLVFTKKIFATINLFKHLNLISSVRLITHQRNSRIAIRAHLYYYKGRRIGGNFKLISRPSKAFYISFKALTLLDKRTGNSIFLVSTTRGLITHTAAIEKKLGGVAIGFFSF